MTISWYPGHMAKAKRLLESQLSRADVVVELCDARIPLSSRNPDLDAMISLKPRLLVLNKADLALTGATNAWIRHFRGSGLNALSAASVKSADAVLSAVHALTREKAERDKSRGIRKTIRAVVVGVPNTGKSSLINRLAGSSIRTENRPGVTRSNQWVKLSPYLELMDTPGLLWPRLGDPACARRLAYVAAVDDAVLDRYRLALALAEELVELAPGAFCARFRCADPALRGQSLMEAVCAGRGFLHKQGQPDLQRAAAAVLEEFRNGKIGRITLEFPREKGGSSRERKTEGGDGAT